MSLFDGKVAIVTGGCGAIGSTVVAMLAEAGAKVVAADVVPNDPARSESRSTSGTVVFQQTDVTDSKSVAAMVDAAVSRFGGLDILVTVAGDTAAAEGTLNDVESQLGISGPLERLALAGDPADVLAAAEYDVIVIGNRGMAGFARVLGSTANTITHRATSNLLLVNTSPAAE